MAWWRGRVSRLLWGVLGVLLFCFIYYLSTVALISVRFTLHVLYFQNPLSERQYNDVQLILRCTSKRNLT